MSKISNNPFIKNDQKIREQQQEQQSLLNFILNESKNNNESIELTCAYYAVTMNTQRLAPILNTLSCESIEAVDSGRERSLDPLKDKLKAFLHKKQNKQPMNAEDRALSAAIKEGYELCGLEKIESAAKAKANEQSRTELRSQVKEIARELTVKRPTSLEKLFGTIDGNDRIDFSNKSHNAPFKKQ
jgi:hypothetical protein